MTTASTFVIVNPTSAGGATARRWPGIRDMLSRQIDFEFALTERSGHATELSREARDSGYQRLVCVGGDGTLHEAVNGLMAYGSAAHPLPSVGLIPSGTGSDLARSLGIPLEIEKACHRLARPTAAVSDLGVVFYRGRTGPERRYFVNAAGLGYDAEVVARRNGFNRYVRGTAPYLVSLVVTLLKYQNRDVTITLDDVRSTRRVNTLVCSIGRFFGGGMRIAPHALLDDGNLDVITLGDVGRLELICNLPRVYSGTHLDHPKVSFERARTVRVESSHPVSIQADGEPVGTTPAGFQVLDRAITFLR